MPECKLSMTIVQAWQGVVEIFFRFASIVMGLAAFICAATAVNNLSTDAVDLRDVEQLRDTTVTGVGIVVGVTLLTILMEGVIIVLRFCTDGVWNAIVDIMINALLALVYFGLAIPIAVFAVEWSNRESSSGAISYDVSAVGDSLAAASVLCFLIWITFIVLAVWMCLLLYFDWNTEVLGKSTSAAGEWYPSTSICSFREGLVEVLIRSVCFVLGIPTFLASAIAVNNLNANTLSLSHVEQSRDKTVAVAGVVVFMGLLTMLTELMAVVMRFCTKDSLSVHMDMVISGVYALAYFCLAIPMALFSEEWKNLESTSIGPGESGDISDDVGKIIGSLTTASISCFCSWVMFTLLAAWMILFVKYKWNKKLELTEESEEHSEESQHMLADGSSSPTAPPTSHVAPTEMPSPSVPPTSSVLPTEMPLSLPPPPAYDDVVDSN